MGRYYSIALTGEGGVPLRQWSSQYFGQDDGGALQIEFDFFEYLYAQPDPGGNCTLTVWGPALEDIQQATNFYNAQITVSAGMSAGLPLANPGQQGVIVQGTVQQAFGNWAGTDQTVEFVIVPSGFFFASPGNLVLNWETGMTLYEALGTMLGTAYPGVPRVINIGQYVNAYDVKGYYSTLDQVAKAIKSQTALGGQNGVDVIMRNNNTLLVTDYTTPGNATQLNFTDFVGQPTWLKPNYMQFSTVLRADIQVGSLVLMPQGLQDAPGIIAIQQQNSPSAFKYRTTFQGPFLVQTVRQVGNFRDPNGTSWVTIFNCTPQGSVNGG